MDYPEPDTTAASVLAEMVGALSLARAEPDPDRVRRHPGRLAGVAESPAWPGGPAMSLMDDIAPGRTGLEQLRAHDGAAARARHRQDAGLPARSRSARAGWCSKASPGAHVYNPDRHGARRLCRHPAGLRLRLRGAFQAERGPGLHHAGAEGRLPQGDDRQTGPVRAEGRVVTIGRRTAFAEARIVDADGRLYASATSTLLVMDR